MQKKKRERERIPNFKNKYFSTTQRMNSPKLILYFLIIYHRNAHGRKKKKYIYIYIHIYNINVYYKHSTLDSNSHVK